MGLEDGQLIPYMRSDGQRKSAQVLYLDVAVPESPRDRMLAFALCAAIRPLTRIAAEQSHPQAINFTRALRDAEAVSPEDQRKAIQEYRLFIAAANGPFTGAGTSFLFRGQITDEAKQVLAPYADLLFGTAQPPRAGTFYPDDITAAEIEQLTTTKDMVATSVVRSNGELRVMPNNVRFARQIKTSVDALERARAYSDRPELIDLSRLAMNGTVATRTARDKAWLWQNEVIDFYADSAIENYMDGHLSLRGKAAGIVTVRRPEYDALEQQLRTVLPLLQARAPWDCKAPLDTNNIPTVRFADVLSWTGGYLSFPGTTLAQNLPNDEETKATHGTKAQMFVNIMEALEGADEYKAIRRVFFGNAPVVLPSVKVMCTRVATHELGHALGGHTSPREPRHSFGGNYSILDEAKQELFSLWALPTLVEQGILKPDDVTGVCYSMLESMLRSTQLPPKDHAGARNLMLHYFLKHGAVVEHGDAASYALNVPQMLAASTDLLRIMGNIWSSGDNGGLDRLMGEYIQMDRKEKIQAKLRNAPSGRLFFFPWIDPQTGKKTYVESYSDQPHLLPSLL